MIVKTFKNRNRLKIPNRIAGLAAILLLVSSVVAPVNPDSQTTLAQQLNEAVVEEAVTELTTVAVAVTKPAAATISSLIFRF
jgi:hypothetical protein